MRMTSSSLPFVLALSAALTLWPKDGAAQPGPMAPMTPLPGTAAPPLGPPLFPMAGGLRTQPVIGAPAVVDTEDNHEAPSGYRVKYAYNEKELITGGAILGLTFTATTLSAAGIAATGFGVLFAPMGGIPVIGAFPLAGFASLMGAGPGTVGGLIALGVGQSVGFGLLMHGLATRKRIGFVPTCGSGGERERDALILSPMASPSVDGLPGFGGLSVGGAL